MKQHILVIEDDTALNQLLCDVLTTAEYQITSVFNAQEALHAIYKVQYDLILLDLRLPDMAGVDVLKKIREFSMVPVIVLTAMADEYTQLLSFNQVISDYITKPFFPSILLKRLENVLQKKIDRKECTFEDLTVEFEAHRVYWKGEKITLTKKEFQIMEVLTKNYNTLVIRDKLMQEIWGYGELETRVLDNHIKQIRKKMPGVPLKTVTGFGFILGDRG